MESGQMFVYNNPSVRYDAIIGWDWLKELKVVNLLFW